MAINQQVMYVNGTRVEASAPMLIFGRTYVDLYAVAPALGIDVENNNGVFKLEADGVAKEFTSVTRTHHTYPLYFKELDLELIDPNDNTSESLECIDHIMMTNSDNVEVNVYGVVVDECSMSGSDHYPIFADVNL
jgi:hypothetical protein